MAYEEYFEKRITVRTDKRGRLIRREETVYMTKTGTTYVGKTRHIHEDEYDMRKSFDRMSRSSMDRINEAYREYKSTYEWD